ncbi:transposase, IS4 family protein [Caballeronia calidae]|uniref:Transposase, IS4 family protein n=1 Tax=Caballeronia calidae TaxID=1777139 RepID=A0A158EKG1_9BURK|nr:transposase, IS4 family protein [Caballeronia calidae]
MENATGVEPWQGEAFWLEMGHTLTDNRHGLVVNARVTYADGHAEREAAKIMINDARQAVQDASAEMTLVQHPVNGFNN